MSIVNAFWWNDPPNNVGDTLTSWLITKAGHVPRYVRAQSAEHKVVGVGSILSKAGENSTIWGTGAMFASDRISKGTRVKAVRGPLTRTAVHKSGVDCPEVYGDPAVLLPLYYPKSRTDKYKVGIAPHYFDKEKVAKAVAERQDSLLLDVTKPVEKFVDDVCSCEIVVSSGLHALIIATAYDIPTLWVEFSNKMIGDKTKFKDFLLSVDADPLPPVDMRNSIPPSDILAKLAKLRTVPKGMSDSLIAARPF